MDTYQSISAGKIANYFSDSLGYAFALDRGWSGGRNFLVYQFWNVHYST